MSAITSMARFLLRIDEVLPDLEHPLVGRPTVNAAMIQGGSAPNVVADRCVVEIDRRIVPGETEPEEVLQPFERLADAIRAEHPEVDLSVEIRQWTDAAETTADTAIADLCRAAVRTEAGRESIDTGFTGITDARFYLNDRSIPTIILGPGSLGVAHMANESVEIAQLVTAARVYARVRRVPGPVLMDRFEVFVIGGGGTGSEVAYQLAERSNLRVAIAERDKLGGECNHHGCVPTKVMLRSAKIARLARDASRFGVRIPSVEIDLPAIQRRARGDRRWFGRGAKPFEDAGVAVFLQQARLIGERRIELEDGTQFEAERIVFATGTDTEVPSIPGLADGPYWTNREAIWAPDAPPSSLAVIGAGAIGIEFAQIYARFGASVTVIEALPQILPNEDEDAAAALVPALEEEGIRLLPGGTIEHAEHDGRGWTISLADGTTFEPRSSSSRRGDGRCSAATISRPSAWSWTIADGRCSPRPCARRPRTCGWRATRPASSCSRTSGRTRRSS